MLILNVALNFTFVCNPEQLQVWQSKQSPYSCFHPNGFYSNQTSSQVEQKKLASLIKMTIVLLSKRTSYVM